MPLDDAVAAGLMLLLLALALCTALALRLGDGTRRWLYPHSLALALGVVVAAVVGIVVPPLSDAIGLPALGEFEWGIAAIAALAVYLWARRAAWAQFPGRGGPGVG
jgi:hypothetical protein